MSTAPEQVGPTAEKQKSTFREYAEAIVMAVVLALFIRTFIVQAFKIPSGSMKPTLLVGDHILVNKFIYGVKLPFVGKTIIPVSEPRRGDVIVFVFPEDRSKDFIKRVVAVGGDTVEIKNKHVYVNGKQVADPHAHFTDRRSMPAELYPRDNLKPRVVPKDHIFVMGDNRDQSYDSRYWGFVPLEDVRGKAFLIYWSWRETGLGVRWSRLGDLVP
jgi:signal peptidase I